MSGLYESGACRCAETGRGNRRPTEHGPTEQSFQRVVKDGVTVAVQDEKGKVRYQASRPFPWLWAGAGVVGFVALLVGVKIVKRRRWAR